MNAKEQKKQAQIERRRAALESEADKLAARIKKSADLILGVGIKKATGARADRLQAAYKRDTKALRNIEVRLLLLEQTASNPATWTAKQERQYKAIEKSEMKRGASKKTAKRIAAATVNKRRAANPSPAQIRARKAFAKMAKERARAARAKKRNPQYTVEAIPKYTQTVREKVGALTRGSAIRKVRRHVKGPKSIYRYRVEKNPRSRNPRYIIRATDASGNERELAILQSPNKMQAVKRAKSLYKGHKKYTAELIDKDDFIGGRAGTQRLKRKRTVKRNPDITIEEARKLPEAQYMKASSLALHAYNRGDEVRYHLNADKTLSLFYNGEERYRISKKGIAKVVNPKRNGVAKTAGKALKKIGGAVLGGVSKVAGKGAKALKNPKRRRNLDHPDSSHHIKVHQHWRAGGLSQWQRAHHAGQHDLFAHGIKAKPKRNPSVKHYAVFYVIRGRSPIRVFEAFTKSPSAAIAAFKKEYPGWNREYSGGKFTAKLQSKRNPSASKIRKKFAGRVSGHKTLYFPKGAPNGMAKLGRLVSMKLKGGKIIKPARRNPSPEIWLCCDTRGKLWLGSTKPGRLYDGAPGDLGTMTNIEYAESKPHLGFPEQTIWFHKLGEVSGRQPHLVVNDDGDLIIKGGAYKITRAGIVD